MKFSLLGLEALVYKYNVLKRLLKVYFTCLLFIRRTSSNQDEKSMMADTCNTQAHELSRKSVFRADPRARGQIILSSVALFMSLISRIFFCTYPSLPPIIEWLNWQTLRSILKENLMGSCWEEKCHLSIWPVGVFYFANSLIPRHQMENVCLQLATSLMRTSVIKGGSNLPVKPCKK